MGKSIKVNVLLNAIRQSLSVIFPLITFPYVSRILGSIEYGKYTFSASIVNYLALLSAFGISNYAIREGARIRDDKKKISQLASDLFTVNLITSVIAYTILFILIHYSSKLQNYKLLIAIQSLCILFTTIGMDWINTIYEDFLYITVRYIIIQILALISVFLFVKSPNDTLIYCFILVCASYSGNLINLVYIRKYVHIKINVKIKLKSYLLPLFILFINSLTTVIYVNSDITMLGLFFNDREVGIYSFAVKIYNIIKYFINAIMITVVPRLTYLRELDEAKYHSYIQSVANVLLIFLLPITFGVFMLSDSIILIAGGKEYLSGDLSLKVLTFALVFALISSVFTNCILIVNRLEKCCLIATTSSACINVILNLVLIPVIGIVGAALTTVVAEMVNMIIQAFYSKKELNIRFILKAPNILSIILGSLFVVFVCLLCNRIWIGNNMLNVCARVIIAFIISVMGYGFILFLTKNDIIKKISVLHNRK